MEFHTKEEESFFDLEMLIENEKERRMFSIPVSIKRSRCMLIISHTELLKKAKFIQVTRTEGCRMSIFKVLERLE